MGCVHSLAPLLGLLVTTLMLIGESRLIIAYADSFNALFGSLADCVRPGGRAHDEGYGMVIYGTPVWGGRAEGWRLGRWCC